MAALSIEMNRLLGSALLDPYLQARIFGEARADVLKGYALSQQEFALVMDSKAHTLTDLAMDICANINSANGKRQPAWMSNNGEVDSRAFRRQTGPDSAQALTPTAQRLVSDLANLLTDVENEYKQGYQVA